MLGRLLGISADQRSPAVDADARPSNVGSIRTGQVQKGAGYFFCRAEPAQGNCQVDSLSESRVPIVNSFAEPGVNNSGCDNVSSNSMGRQFLCHHFHEHFLSALAAAIPFSFS